MWPVCTVDYRHCPAGALVLLGFPTPVPALLSFLQIWLDKGRRYKRRAVLFSKGQSRGGKTACRDFQLFNQNSNVSVFIFLPFIH